MDRFQVIIWIGQVGRVERVGRVGRVERVGQVGQDVKVGWVMSEGDVVAMASGAMGWGRSG